MCGIAGITDPQLAAAELLPIVRRMTGAIFHRGPDDDGHFVQDGLAIGMRRLSIIDVAGGQQPLTNETGDVHVVCNGEIYNFEELRQDLLGRGHTFRTRSDVEVIAHLYEERGSDCFRDLRGMFGIALWDARRQRLLLARDRLGKKPLYYACPGGRLLFGSEMKSLLAAEPRLSEPDYSRLPEYLRYGYLLEPATIYRSIHKLPAASFAIWERGRLNIARYWNVEFREEIRSDADWRADLDQLLETCVRDRLQSEVPLGVFLSGGIDSSAVVAYAARAGLKPLRTFTIGFDRPEWDESEDALRVARHFGTEHHDLRLREADLRRELPDTISTLGRHFDEPFGDESALPTYYVSKLAREHVTVILSGDGGDELFAGYNSYRGAIFAEQYRRWIPRSVGRDLLPGGLSHLARWLPETLRYRALRIAKILRDSGTPWPQGFHDKVSIWRPSELSRLLSPDLLRESGGHAEALYPEPLEAILHSTRDLIQKLTEVDIRAYLLDDILVKVDRMSMAHALEVRSPFLDHRLVEFAASMPSRLKLRGRTGKAVLRDVLRPQLPPSTARKPKQGFSVPLRDWFRGPLASWIEDRLQPGPQGLPHELFDAATVRSVLREHRQGAADHGRKIWTLLAFAAWHAQYQSGVPAPCAASQAC